MSVCPGEKVETIEQLLDAHGLDRMSYEKRNNEQDAEPRKALNKNLDGDGQK